MFSFLACASLVAQEAAPEQLKETAYCLISDKHDWIAARGKQSGALHLKFVAEPETSTVTVIDESKELVIDFRRIGKKQWQVVNNARFQVSKRGVEYPDPPLGGVWTQDRLSKRVKTALASKAYILRIEDLRKLSGISCSSYADR